MKKGLLGILTLLILIFDLMTKSAAVLNGSAVMNTGISFGLFKGMSPMWHMLFTVVIITCIILLFQIIEPDKYNTAGAAMMAAGALGNLFDRIFLGYVRDWLFVPFSKQIFTEGLCMNIADAALIIGAILIFISFIQSIFTLKLR